MNQKEWIETSLRWLQENATTPDEGKTWYCKDDDAILQGEGKYASLHLPTHMLGGLAGVGETVELIQPYCPKCKKRLDAPQFIEYNME